MGDIQAGVLTPKGLRVALNQVGWREAKEGNILRKYGGVVEPGAAEKHSFCGFNAGDGDYLVKQVWKSLTLTQK